MTHVYVPESPGDNRCAVCGMLPSSKYHSKWHSVGDIALSQAAGDEPILQFFEYGHEPLSRQFMDLANMIVATLPRNPERTVALRKLLEAKDCAVRTARLYR